MGVGHQGFLFFFPRLIHRLLRKLSSVSLTPWLWMFLWTRKHSAWNNVLFQVMQVSSIRPQRHHLMFLVDGFLLVLLTGGSCAPVWSCKIPSSQSTFYRDMFFCAPNLPYAILLISGFAHLNCCQPWWFFGYPWKFCSVKCYFFLGTSCDMGCLARQRRS